MSSYLLDTTLARFHADSLTEDKFKAMRLRNGLYIQRFAPIVAHQHPLRPCESVVTAPDGTHRTHLFQGLRALHHARIKVVVET